MPSRKSVSTKRTVNSPHTSQHQFKSDSAFYHQLLESLEDYVIFTTDIKGYVNSWNSGAEKIFGYTEKEILGKDAEIFYTPEDRQARKPEKELAVSQKTGRAVNERWHVRKDGSRFWGSGLVFPLRDTAGNVQGFTKVMRDLTEQKQLMESQERLANIVESSEDAILSRSLDGTVLSWNKGAEKMYGFTAEEAYGKDISITIPPERTHEADDIINAIKQGRSIKHFETVRHRKDGSSLTVSISVSPIRSHMGELIGISTIARDITEMSKLQQQKDEFIGIASHELKTPVTSIKAYTQVLLNRFAKKGDTTSADLLTKMDTQIDKLNNLIGDLLDVTKIESGRLHFNPGFFDFNELVGEIIEEMQRTTKKHTIIKKLEKTKTVYGDRDRIGQVMMNLISNAIKYSPQSDKIIVKTDRQRCFLWNGTCDRDRCSYCGISDICAVCGKTFFLASLIGSEKQNVEPLPL